MNKKNLPGAVSPFVANWLSGYPAGAVAKLIAQRIGKRVVGAGAALMVQAAIAGARAGKGGR